MKMIRTAALLLVLTLMTMMCSSCRYMDNIQYTYSDFQRREATYEDLKELGVYGTVVYAPYVYTCAVTRTDILDESENAAKDGECIFIPYVVCFRQDVATKYSGQEQWTAVLKVAEMTRIQGSGYFGETPFECRNVEIALAADAYTELMQPNVAGVYIDGTSLSTNVHEDGRKAVGLLMDSVPVTADNALERIQKTLDEASRFNIGWKDPALANPDVATVVSLAMVDNTQRVQKDTNSKDGHSYGASTIIDLNRRVEPQAGYKNNGNYTGYAMVNFEVYNTSNGAIDALSTGLVEINYELDMDKNTASSKPEVNEEY